MSWGKDYISSVELQGVYRLNQCEKPVKKHFAIPFKSQCSPEVQWIVTEEIHFWLIKGDELHHSAEETQVQARGLDRATVEVMSEKQSQ